MHLFSKKSICHGPVQTTLLGVILVKMPQMPSISEPKAKTPVPLMANWAKDVFKV